MNKKPGRVLLICIIVLAIICPLHIYHDKKKVEDIKSGAIVIQNSETPIDELHPEFAYLWLFPSYALYFMVLVDLLNITYGQAHLIRKKSPVDTVTKSIESVV